MLHMLQELPFVQSVSIQHWLKTSVTQQENKLLDEVPLCSSAEGKQRGARRPLHNTTHTHHSPNMDARTGRGSDMDDTSVPDTGQPRLPPICDDDDGDIASSYRLPIAFKINEREREGEVERGRERERSVYFPPHADSCAATPHTCSHPGGEKERGETLTSPFFSFAPGFLPLQLLFFFFLFLWDFSTVSSVAFATRSRVWHEQLSCLRRLHASMGTAVSKRKSLRNDAISSVAAKVRWVAPGASYL